MALWKLALSGCLACGSALGSDIANEPIDVPSLQPYAVRLDAAGLAHGGPGLWLGSGRASLGFGLAMPAHISSAPEHALHGAQPANAPTLLVGMRYRLSDRSLLYFDTNLNPQAARDASGAERPLRLGMEFKSAPAPALGLAHGALLRAQLSATSNLSLRMRRGGLSVVLRAQF